MPRVDVVVPAPHAESFRVQQIAGMFDVPLDRRQGERFTADLPGLDEDWSIGLIAGPSASGKTTLAQAAFGKAIARTRRWPADRAAIDCLGDRPIKDLVGLFTAVGLGTPSAWIRPYRALSTGEQFRCDLARALAAGRDGSLVAFDEFTAAVDRRVARSCSAALAKAIRAGRIRRRFVAITCHTDIARWLAPDWILDTLTGRLTRRRLRRPTIRLDIHRADPDAWRMFAKHHYLSGGLNPAARCYLAVWKNDPVAFCALLHQIGRKQSWRVSRLVVRPEDQGLGIGAALLDEIGSDYAAAGDRLSISTSHPAMIAHCARSPAWRFVRLKRAGGRVPSGYRAYHGSPGRATMSFAFVVPPSGGEREAGMGSTSFNRDPKGGAPPSENALPFGSRLNDPKAPAVD